MASDIEFEKKFEIPDEQTLVRIRTEAESRTIPGVRVEHMSGPHCRFDIYHDTPSRIFLAKDMILRMSLGGEGVDAGAAAITFKAPTDRTVARHEHTETYSIEWVDLQLSGKAGGGVIERARTVAGDEPFGPVLRVAKLYWIFTGRGWECAFGHVMSAGARGAIEDLDLEVELKRGGDEQRVLKVARNLRGRYDLKERRLSKYQAGMKEVG